MRENIYQKCIICGKMFKKSINGNRGKSLDNGILGGNRITCSNECSVKNNYKKIYDRANKKDKCKCGNLKKVGSKKCRDCHTKLLNSQNTSNTENKDE